MNRVRPPILALWALGCVTGLLPARSQIGAPVSEAPAPAELTLRYVANEGFLVEGGNRRILIDALFGAGVSGYPVAPDELRERVERGDGEWRDVTVALASHYHPDHFDADAVARFLSANPEALFVSTPQAVHAFRAAHGDAPELLERVRGVLPSEGSVEHLVIRGVRIDVLNLHHGREPPITENLGFVVTLGDTRLLHFGDTEATMEDFAPYLGLLEGTELALLPFWFLSSEWRAEMVRERIRPRWVVAAHLPLPDAPSYYFARWKSHGELLRSIRAAFPDAHLPDRPGEVVVLGD